MTEQGSSELAEEEATLAAISRRVLWLAVRMVDYANHDRTTVSGMKVGGHQASSASMVSLMVALWFAHLRAEDRVAVKPHASPVYHAIRYLLGELDRSYLTSLRAFGGLQAYPSRTKDPDRVDLSTGSVGLGAVAPLCAAAVARYLRHHIGETPEARFVALLGDAELDEGNVWEALADPALQGLGNVLWVVDLNRQSLDRVVPGIKVDQLVRQFEANGWQVLTAKYGRRLQAFFQRPGGDALRWHIDAMRNEDYQACFGLRGGALRDRFLAGADPSVKQALAEVSDAELAPLVHDLGGHDFSELLAAYRAADRERDRPTVVFAYTIKGWGLPFAGQRLNHAALLTTDQIDRLRADVGLTPENEWEPFDPGSPEERACRRAARRLAPPSARPRPATVPVPVEVGLQTRRPLSTQEAFGRVLVQLGKQLGLGERLVTAAPDVAISTSLGGWINRVGVFDPEPSETDDGEDILAWRPGPGGQHIELGISEMNLFLLLGQLGLSGELHGERLVPIGTVYDPFVCRGLDGLIYSVYSGARFIVAGTPSGITLATEGGAHQSTITPGIGTALPGLTYAEPAYVTALDWLLCDAVGDIANGRGEALYLRLTTRPIDQGPFEQARQRDGDRVLRRHVLRGAYRLLDVPTPGAPRVVLYATGAIVPETLEAARILGDEGVAPLVVDVTSPGRLYRDWRRSLRADVEQARHTPYGGLLAELLGPAERSAPIVTVQDGTSHALAWVGSVFGSPAVPLGVDAFGESGDLHDLYRAHGLTAGAIVNAALRALGGRDGNGNDA